MKEIRKVSIFYGLLSLIGLSCFRSQRTGLTFKLSVWCLRIGVFTPRAFLETLSEAPFFLFPERMWAILSGKKVKSKHIRNERNKEIIKCPPPSWDTIELVISVAQLTDIEHLQCA